MDLDAFILLQEGRKLVAYGDPITGAAPYTIGIGHTGPEVMPGLVWRDDQVDFAYQLDKGHAWQGCADSFQPWFMQLNEPRQTVLISMCFQMGIHGLLGFKDMIGNIRDELYANAAECMRQSKWARQTPARMRTEAAMLETGNW